jgi:opacity protein-like surface antigen
MKHIVLFAMVTAGTGLLAQEAVVPTAISSVNPIQSNDNRAVFDVYGVIPHAVKGGGFGLGIFSPAIGGSIFGSGAEFRLGADFYLTGLGHKTMENVPLLAPQTGNAKARLSETLFGFNAVARISFPWSEKVSPYVDAFAGLRAVSTDISVTAYNYQPGYDKTSSDNLDNASSFNYGLAGGLLISINKNIKLNTAVLFSRSQNPGAINNIQTASMEGTSIAMDKKAVSRDIIIYKVGLTFKINPSKKSDCCHCNDSRNRSVSSGGSSWNSGSWHSSPSRVSIGGVRR